MPRLAKFSHEQIVDATARIAARAGPGHVTIAAVAGEIKAPTGSIYHRFGSRDLLLAEVWLKAANEFQTAYVEKLSGDDAWEAGLEAVLFVPARVRERPDEARILLLHRREDFFTGAWPAEMASRAAALKRQVDDAHRGFCKRLLGRTDAESLRALKYALVDAPLAAILPDLRVGKAPPAMLDGLLRATYVAVVGEKRP